jgi:hypothetical protein
VCVCLPVCLSVCMCVGEVLSFLLWEQIGVRAGTLGPCKATSIDGVAKVTLLLQHIGAFGGKSVSHLIVRDPLRGSPGCTTLPQTGEELAFLF